MAELKCPRLENGVSLKRSSSARLLTAANMKYSIKLPTYEEVTARLKMQCKASYEYIEELKKLGYFKKSETVLKSENIGASPIEFSVS